MAFQPGKAERLKEFRPVLRETPSAISIHPKPVTETVCDIPNMPVRAPESGRITPFNPARMREIPEKETTLTIQPMRTKLPSL